MANLRSYLSPWFGYESNSTGQTTLLALEVLDDQIFQT